MFWDFVFYPILRFYFAKETKMDTLVGERIEEDGIGTIILKK
jgi:hypothetical protein